MSLYLYPRPTECDCAFYIAAVYMGGNIVGGGKNANDMGKLLEVLKTQF
jgi:hypothetical protein